MMTGSFFRQLAADARFYRALRRPDQPVTVVGLLLTCLGNRGLWLLTFHRIAYYSTFHRNLRNPVWWLARLMEAVGMYLNALISKSEVMSDCEMPGPVYLSSRGYYMLGALRVGAGTIVHHCVTFGMAVANGRSERPTVGAKVWIGPNCVIAGKLHIGDGSTVLPDTYLTYSVPPGTVVKGNPARIIRKEFDNSALRRSTAVVTELPAALES